jgi:hypothetical protein
MHRQGSSPFGPFGAILMLLGIGMMLYGLLSSGAPTDSETLNLGLLDDKSNTVSAGGFLFTSGAVFVAASAIIGALRDALLKQVSDGNSPEESILDRAF